MELMMPFRHQLFAGVGKLMVMEESLEIL
jgi:hypothetical protein